MRLRDIAAILVALAMTGALLLYVTGTFSVNRTALAFMATFFLFAGLGHWITSDPARRQTITAHKVLFIVSGVAVTVLAAGAAITLWRVHDLVHGSFTFATIVFLAGLEIAYLPRACGWYGRFAAKRTRQDERQ